jgi:hypothetical protein
MKEDFIVQFGSCLVVREDCFGSVVVFEFGDEGISMEAGEDDFL